MDRKQAERDQTADELSTKGCAAKLVSQIRPQQVDSIHSANQTSCIGRGLYS